MKTHFETAIPIFILFFSFIEFIEPLYSQEQALTNVSEQSELERKNKFWHSLITEVIDDNLASRKSTFSELKNIEFLLEAKKAGKKPPKQSIEYTINRGSEILAKFNYTLEDAMYLIQNHSINLIDEAFDYGETATSSVFFSDIVVWATVDTVYMDNSMEDGHFLSYKLKIKKVLKGAVVSGNVIVRDYVFYLQYNPRNEKQEMYAEFTDVEEDFFIHDEYLVFLSKENYSQQLQSITATTRDKVIDGKHFISAKNLSPEIQALRANCYGIVYNLPLTHGSSWSSAARIKSEVDKTKILCKELLPFFSQKLRKKP